MASTASSSQPSTLRQLPPPPPRIQEAAEHLPRFEPLSNPSPNFSTERFPFDDEPPQPGDPLTEEGERIRAGIGDVTDQVPETGGPELISSEESELRELMQSIAFEEEDVKEQLAELCEYLAEVLKSEHWKLSERQKRMLGRPIALLMNSVWARLQDYLPRFFAEWCERTPGLFASMTACTFVFGPKIMKQIRLNRERRRLHPMPPPGAPAAPRSARPASPGPVGSVAMQDAPPAEESSKGGITWE